MQDGKPTTGRVLLVVKRETPLAPTRFTGTTFAPPREFRKRRRNDVGLGM